MTEPARDVPYVIIVTFDLQPGRSTDFMPEMLRNASTSRQVEPGCLTFDVLVPKDAPDRVVLYEVYRSRADFEDHCNRPHFLEFDATTRPLVRAKSFVEFRLETLGETAWV